MIEDSLAENELMESFRDDTGYTDTFPVSYSQMALQGKQKEAEKPRKSTLTGSHFESVINEERPYSPPFANVIKDTPLHTNHDANADADPHAVDSGVLANPQQEEQSTAKRITNSGVAKNKEAEETSAVVPGN